MKNTGQLMKTFGTTATTFNFPVGDNTSTLEYSPVSFTSFSGFLQIFGYKYLESP